MRVEKLLLRSKRIEKFKDKRITPNKLIEKGAFNLNNTRSAKYKYSPEQIEEKAFDPDRGKYFQEIYDSHRLIKVKENRDRTGKFDAKIDKPKKRLRDPLVIGEKVLVLAGRLRKQDAPGRLYKSTTQNKSFFNRTITFAISERLKLILSSDNTYLYWLKENGQKIKNKFLRQELFALKNQFVE